MGKDSLLSPKKYLANKATPFPQARNGVPYQYLVISYFNAYITFLTFAVNANF